MKYLHSLRLSSILIIQLHCTPSSIQLIILCMRTQTNIDTDQYRHRQIETQTNIDREIASN